MHFVAGFCVAYSDTILTDSKVFGVLFGTHFWLQFAGDLLLMLADSSGAG